MDKTNIPEGYIEVDPINEALDDIDFNAPDMLDKDGNPIITKAELRQMMEECVKGMHEDVEKAIANMSPEEKAHIDEGMAKFAAADTMEEKFRIAKEYFPEDFKDKDWFYEEEIALPDFTDRG